MTDQADYETLLRSMSALSQQFTQRRPRTMGTPPNPMLSQTRSRSRVSKPRSNTASPASVAARRRRAVTSLQQRPFTYHDQQAAMPSQDLAANSLASSTPFFATNSSNLERPRSWHPDLQAPSAWAYPAQPLMTADDMSNAYMDMNMYGYMYNPFNLMYCGMPAMSGTAWMQPHMPAVQPYMFDQSGGGSLYGSNNAMLAAASMDAASSMPTHSTSMPDAHYINAVEQSTQSYPSESDESDYDDDSSDDGGELVGMGLYDRSNSNCNQPSLLLGAGLHEPEPAALEGKGLQLEETWAPPADQVPEAEDDEGSDTPVTFDFQAWTPHEQQAMIPDESVAQAPYYSNADLLGPQVRQSDWASTNMFFDDDGDMMSEDLMASQQKQLPANWSSGDWHYSLDSLQY